MPWLGGKPSPGLADLCQHEDDRGRSLVTEHSSLLKQGCFLLHGAKDKPGLAKAAGEHSRVREPYAQGWGRRACAPALAIPLRPGNCRTRAVPPVSATRAFVPGLVPAEPSRGSEPGCGLCLRAAAEAGVSSRRTKPDGRGAGLANEGREGGGGVPCLNSGAGSPDLLRPAAPTGMVATGAGLAALPAPGQPQTVTVTFSCHKPHVLSQSGAETLLSCLARDLSCSLLPVRDGARRVAVGNLSPVTLPKRFGVTLLAPNLELHISRLRLHLFT